MKASNASVEVTRPSINRDTFEKVFSRYTRIQVSKLARLLKADEISLELWLLDLPSEFGFTIDVDMLIMDKGLIGSQIDDLFKDYERAEQQKIGKLE